MHLVRWLMRIPPALWFFALLSARAAWSAPAVETTPPPTLPGAPASPAGEFDFGAWSPLTGIGRQGPAAVFDPAAQHWIMFGGLLQDVSFLDDVTELRLDGPPRWAAQRLSGVAAARDQAAAAWDPQQQRMIVYGGKVRRPDRGGTYCEAFSDVVEIRAAPKPSIRTTNPAGGPGERYGSAAIWDSRRGRMLLFGGIEHTIRDFYCGVGTRHADLWTLSGDPLAWTPLAQFGAIPPAGNSGNAIADAGRDRMLFVAGDGVWALALATNEWSLLLTAGSAATPAGTDPDPPRSPAVLDPARDRLLVQRGAETWAFPAQGGAWERIATQGGAPAVLPGCITAWDPTGNRMLLYGGSRSEEALGPADVWALSFATTPPSWSKLGIEALQWLYPLEMVYDPERDRALAFFDSLGVMQLDLAHPEGWQRLETTGLPYVRTGHIAIADPKRDRVLMFGGAPPDGSSLVDPSVWALSLADNTWQTLPGSSAVPRRFLMTGVLDPVRDRLVIFGGYRTIPSGSTDDVWMFDLATSRWSRAVTSGTPPGESIYRRSVYDPVLDRMVVFSWYDGPTGAVDPLVQTLTLAGDTLLWEPVANIPYLSSDFLPSIVWDPLRARAVLYGGHDDVQLWSLQFFASGWSYWTNLDIHCCGMDEFAPPTRSIADALYDPVRDAMVTAGGYHGSGDPLGDAWEYVWGRPEREVAIDIRPGDDANLVNPGSQAAVAVAILSDAKFDATTVDPGSVTLAQAPPKRDGQGRALSEIADVNRDGRADLIVKIDAGALKLTAADTVAVLVGHAPGNLTVHGCDRVRVIGGATRAGSQATGAEAEPTPALAIEALRVAGALEVRFALASAAAARLELLDIAGRRIEAREVGALGAGHHALALGAGRDLAPGVYLVRLRQGAATVVKKAALLR